MYVCNQLGAFTLIESVGFDAHAYTRIVPISRYYVSLHFSPRCEKGQT